MDDNTTTGAASKGKDHSRRSGETHDKLEAVREESRIGCCRPAAVREEVSIVFTCWLRSAGSVLLLSIEGYRAGLSRDTRDKWVRAVAAVDEVAICCEREQAGWIKPCLNAAQQR